MYVCILGICMHIIIIIIINKYICIALYSGKAIPKVLHRNSNNKIIIKFKIDKMLNR